MALSAPSSAPAPLILILGPTASGKTALALALALAIGGEVVSADAMAVYRDMDIGTAKPSPAELAAVPHHLISILDPGERCDVSRWLALADAAVADIRARGRVAIVSGGSPLYTKALLEGLSAGPPRDDAVRDALRERYRQEGGAALLTDLQRVDPLYAGQRHANDERRIVRALEVHALSGRAYSSFHTTAGVRRADALLIGLEWERSLLYARIDARAGALFARGLVDEVMRVKSRLGPEARQAVGYKEVLAAMDPDGRVDRTAALERVRIHSRHLAKHQLTWYRRFPDIRWLPGDAPDLVDRAVALVRSRMSS